MRGGRGENAQTRAETFLEQLAEAQENMFQTFMSGIRYEEGMKGKWSLNEAKMTFLKTSTMYSENKQAVLPGIFFWCFFLFLLMGKSLLVFRFGCCPWLFVECYGRAFCL